MSYAPVTTIISGLTDEALKSERSYKGDAAAALLRVPAEYRHPVEAEVLRRSSRTENRNGNLVSHHIRDPQEARLEIIAEVLAQLAVSDAG